MITMSASGMRENYALIVAGGLGQRFGSEMPKQFLPLHSKPIFLHAVLAFLSVLPAKQMVIVIPKGMSAFWEGLVSEFPLLSPIMYTEGGDERFYSVKEGLKRIPDNTFVAVHDAARPLVSSHLILEGFRLVQAQGPLIPVVKLKDSIRMLNEDDSISVKRDAFRAVQTPQFFPIEMLKEAYKRNFESGFTDDATVVENAGYKITMFEGESSNIKITSREDLYLAAILMDSANPPVFPGITTP